MYGTHDRLAATAAGDPAASNSDGCKGATTIFYACGMSHNSLPGRVASTRGCIVSMQLWPRPGAPHAHCPHGAVGFITSRTQSAEPHTCFVCCAVQVEDALYSLVEPTPTGTEPYLVAYSKDTAALLDLDTSECERCAC